MRRAQVRFSNRYDRLLKKARELSILCDADVAVIRFSTTGQLYQWSSTSMEHILSRYNRSMAAVNQSQKHPSDEQKAAEFCLNKVNSQPIDINNLKEQYLRLRTAYMQLNGKELEGLSVEALEQLEHQLNEGILSVKKKREQTLQDQLRRSRLQEQTLLDQPKRSRLQEQRVILENETLRKEVEELRQKTSPNLLELDLLQRRISLNSTPNADYDRAIEGEGDENDGSDHSDTSLNLWLSSDVGRESKVAKK
ncbi:hypothetical protein DITRI_Ditri06bG0013800 [Diplodiscus trichospermus]